MNPINPKKVLAGAGSVPSMGLSQFRGGKKTHTLADHLAHPMKGFGEKEMEDEDSEDEEMKGAGRLLFSQMKDRHGGAAARAFMKGFHGGMNTGAYEGEGKPKMTGGQMLERMIGAGQKEDRASCVADEAPRGGRRKRAPAGPSDARRQRGAMISKLMKEHGMTLGEASKYLKEHK